MLNNKVLINLYVLSLDKNFELFVPVDEKVGNIVKLLNKSLFKEILSNGNLILFNLYTGNVYKNNDLVRNTDIQNGTKLMLI